MSERGGRRVGRKGKKVVRATALSLCLGRGAQPGKGTVGHLIPSDIPSIGKLKDARRRERKEKSVEKEKGEGKGIALIINASRREIRYGAVVKQEGRKPLPRGERGGRGGRFGLIFNRRPHLHHWLQGSSAARCKQKKRGREKKEE